MFKMTWAKPAGKNSTHDGEEPGSGTHALALVVLFGSILYMFMGIGGAPGVPGALRLAPQPLSLKFPPTPRRFHTWRCTPPPQNTALAPPTPLLPPCLPLPTPSACRATLPPPSGCLARTRDNVIAPSSNLRRVLVRSDGGGHARARSAPLHQGAPHRRCAVSVACRAHVHRHAVRA